MNNSILLILTGDDYSSAAKAAFDHAALTSGKVHVLQILNSELYHYGHHDLVATRHSKQQFLLYIREEVLERGRSAVKALEQSAREKGITLEIHSVESEDALSTSLSEAKKGYALVFLPKQKRHLFPIFKRALAKNLQRRLSGRVVSC